MNFIFALFQNIDWKSKDESTGVPSLSKVAITKTDILLPDHKEQQQIVKCFIDLYNLITLHQRKGLSHRSDNPSQHLGLFNLFDIETTLDDKILEEIIDSDI